MPQSILPWPAAYALGAVRDLGQVVQVGPFGLVKVERGSDSVEHAVGYAFEVAAFQSGVVVDADPSEQGNLFAA